MSIEEIISYCSIFLTWSYVSFILLSIVIPSFSVFPFIIWSRCLFILYSFFKKNLLYVLGISYHCCHSLCAFCSAELQNDYTPIMLLPYFPDDPANDLQCCPLFLGCLNLLAGTSWPNITHRVIEFYLLTLLLGRPLNPKLPYIQAGLGIQVVVQTTGKRILCMRQQ